MNYFLKVVFLLGFMLGGFNIGYAQISNGKITYAVNMDRWFKQLEEKNIEKPSESIKIFKAAQKSMSNINMTLSFNKEIALFEQERGMGLDEQDATYKMASILISNGQYYTNLEKKKQLLITNFNGSKNYVEAPFKKIIWDLGKEEKKVGDISCYKAEYTRETPKGPTTIVAWYAPSIPLSYGPKEYVGTLPGLILELHDFAISYTCTSIELNLKKPVDIEWPNDIETITQEEYEKKGKEIIKKIKQGGD